LFGIAAACNSVSCQNGGTCFQGQCQCPLEWTGATCNVAQDGCTKAAASCGIWGNCSGNSCSCAPGFSGDRCQYPPNCGIRCANNGLPNSPQLVLSPGNTWGCTFCTCVGYWEGTTCGKCGLNCYNGGSVNGNCTACNCPTWRTGDNCQYKYWLASFTVNLSPSNGFNTLADSVTADLVGVLPSFAGQFSVTSVGNTVTLWIFSGEMSSVVRANIKRQVTGQNYYSSTQGLPYPTTLTGSAVNAASWSESDPPSAGAFTIPSLLLTLVVMILGILMN